MTREQVKQLTLEAGLKTPARGDFILIHWDQIEMLIKHEREACAKVCEKEAVQIVVDGLEERAYNNAVSDCASAIRARGNN